MPHPVRCSTKQSKSWRGDPQQPLETNLSLPLHLAKGLCKQRIYFQGSWYGNAFLSCPDLALLSLVITQLDEAQITGGLTQQHTQWA